MCTWWTNWGSQPVDPDALHAVATVVLPEALGKGLEDAQKINLGLVLLC